MATKPLHVAAQEKQKEVWQGTFNTKKQLWRSVSCLESAAAASHGILVAIISRRRDSCPLMLVLLPSLAATTITVTSLIALHYQLPTTMMMLVHGLHCTGLTLASRSLCSLFLIKFCLAIFFTAPFLVLYLYFVLLRSWNLSMSRQQRRAWCAFPGKAVAPGAELFLLLSGTRFVSARCKFTVAVAFKSCLNSRMKCWRKKSFSLRRRQRAVTRNGNLDGGDQKSGSNLE